MFEGYYKLKEPTFAHLLFTATCSRMNLPVNQTNSFLMVTFLIPLRSLRVHILEQLFTSSEVHIVEVDGIIQQYELRLRRKIVEHVNTWRVCQTRVHKSLIGNNLPDTLSLSLRK